MASRSTIRRLPLAGAGLALTGLIVAACGGGTSSPAASGSSTTSTTSSSSGGGSETEQLGALQTSVQSAKGATFKATYTGTSSNGTSTITIEQKPPKTLFSEGSGGQILNNGTTTYYCSNSGGHTTCVTMSATGNPLAALFNLYNGSTAVSLFQQWRSQLAARTAGVDVKFTSQTFAGQSAKCVTWGYQGQSAKYCVTDAGVLAYAGGTGSASAGSFQLTSYSTDVSDSDFSPPPGATVQSVPQR